jgi:sugar phosphate isomerase/epimerase
MDFLVCAFGEPEERQFLPEIEKLGFGIELQSYGLKGALSLEAWERRIQLHQQVVNLFHGRLAVHGPFLGISYNYKDHLLMSAVRERMEMTFEAVEMIRPDTLVMHTGLGAEVTTFKFEEEWLTEVSAFWKNEIKRYAAIGVRVALENILEQTPEMMIELADRIGHPNLGLCLDVGHLNIIGKISHAEWISRLGKRLIHVHLHDNHGIKDQHLPIGKGSINFDPIFQALWEIVPEVTVSLEIDAKGDEVIESARYIKQRYARA